MDAALREAYLRRPSIGVFVGLSFDGFGVVFDKLVVGFNVASGDLWNSWGRKENW